MRLGDVDGLAVNQLWSIHTPLVAAIANSVVQFCTQFCDYYPCGTRIRIPTWDASVKRPQCVMW